MKLAAWGVFIFLFAVIILSIVYISENSQNDITPFVGFGSFDNNPQNTCIELCQKKLKAAVNLSAGQCLSDNNPEWKITGWVCDVAHDPREDIDNLPENQCADYREERAGHFVEVDTNCNLIRLR